VNEIKVVSTVPGKLANHMSAFLLLSSIYGHYICTAATSFLNRS